MEEEATISRFVEQLNDLRDDQQMKRLTGVFLTSKLMESGYIVEKYNPLFGRNTVTATPKGLEAGISSSKRISEKGNEYEVLVYNEESLRLLLSLIPREDA
jgi:ATP-dependent DNA helicase RecQ